MHHIYHTEGIILGSKNYREADKYYAIFTRELGMVYASAQGVRKISSKLRFVLQDFNYLKIDLVRGKDFWRITSASKINKLENLTKDPKKLFIFANINKLLRRLLAGEEPNENLFEDLVMGLNVLEKNTDDRELSNIEAILVLRILSNLGYVGGGDELDILTTSPFAKDLVYEVGKNRKRVLSEINRALNETHL